MVLINNILYATKKNIQNKNFAKDIRHGPRKKDIVIVKMKPASFIESRRTVSQLSQPLKIQK